VPNYLLLLHNNTADARQLSPEEVQHAIQKFFAWRKRLVEEKILVGTAKLNARIIHATDLESLHFQA